MLKQEVGDDTGWDDGEGEYCGGRQLGKMVERMVGVV